MAAVSVSVDTLREGANLLSTQAVEVRYPSIFTDKEDALKALEVADVPGRAMRQALGVGCEIT